MKNIYILLLIFSVFAQAQIVDIPDSGFKSALVNAGVDTNGDGEIDSAEALAITTLNVVGNISIFSITGIESFTNLNVLEFSGHVIIINADFRMLTNLTSLIANNFQAQTFLVSGLANLKHLECNNSRIGSLNLTGVGNLEYLDASLNPELGTLILTSLPNLTTLKCNNTNLNTLTANQFPNLEHLDCAYSQNMFSLDVSGLPALTYLVCNDSSLMTLNLGSITNIEVLDCSNNVLTTLSIGGLIHLTSLKCNNNDLTVLPVDALTNLNILECDGNQLTALNVTNMSQLVLLSCSSNLIASLNTNVLLQLENLHCRSNRLTNLNLSSLSQLKVLDCPINLLTNLTLPVSSQLENLICYDNQLTSLDISVQSLLKAINFPNNQIANLNFTATPLVTFFRCENNMFQTVDISAFPNLVKLVCGNPSLTQIVSSVQNNNLEAIDIINSQTLTTIDFSNFTNLSNATISQTAVTNLDFSANPGFLHVNLKQNPNLEYINLKNGISSFVFFEWEELPSLRHICSDNESIPSIYTELSQNGITNVEVNSYCSFVPSGNYNTITGSVRFDSQNDGCENDVFQPNIKLSLSDGTGQYASFTSGSNNYNFYTLAGDFTITPAVENSDIFTITPQSANINFPDSNNNVSTQNFCLTANGGHNDLEIVLTPILAARPGFDAIYKIVYKNKGNQTLEGNLTLTFDEIHMDFINSSSSPLTINPGLLTYNYVSLLPFESREILITMNINSPVETNPVNINDVLVFTANIPVASDEIPDDNTFVLNQVVIGSYDPNDITCLQGDRVSSDHIGKYLHYNINFENTGTADAENIVIKDSINTAQFDIHSLQILNSSHAMNVKIKGNVIEFIFEGINLRPSSTHPIGGHGNVLFKIKSKADLPAESLVENMADIYFDYNAPIATNEAETTFALLNNQDFERDHSVKTYPNPASDFVKIQSKNTIKSIQLFDIQGRVLQTTIENKKETTIDLSKQSNGIYFLKISTEKGSKIERIIKS